MIKLFVDCPHCLGAAKIELAGHLKETLAVVVRRGEITAPQVWAILFEHTPKPERPSIPSINARLNELVAYGYLRRHSEGRKVLYSLSAQYELLRVRSDGKFYFTENNTETHEPKPVTTRARRGAATRRASTA